MAKFKDRLDREWCVSFTTPHLPHLREAGFNLGMVGRDDRVFEVLGDPENLVRILWITCEEQATKKGISEEQFASGFDGPTIFAATDAVMVAIVDFTHRPAVANAIKARLPGAMADLEMSRIQNIETTTRSGSNTSAGNSPPSPDSTPTA